MSAVNRKILRVLLALQLWIPCAAAHAFVIKDIQVVGLSRIRQETVISYVPVKVGQDFQAKQSRSVIAALYKTDFFDDIRLQRRGNTLVINVRERPVIGLMNISGNKIIKTEEIKKVLKENGIAEGLVYDRAKFSLIKNSLEQQYFNQGRYNAQVKTTVQDKGRGRVALMIDIYEGQTAKIKKITIIGNRHYTQAELEKNFKLGKSKLWSPIFHNDQYSREKLNADIESLRSFYMDRGYLNFQVSHVQVSITPDKKDVFITLSISEGNVYTLSDYDIQGNIGADKGELLKLIMLKRGTVFSRKDVIESTKSINHFYQDHGFAYAKVDIRPKVDEKRRQIFVSYVVDPGKRVYVRRVHFVGNTRTQDEVLRRQMRQFEGALYSEKNLNLSKRKIDNLGFVEKVTVTKQPVPGHPDQIDVYYKMSEASTASAQAQMGYSNAVGFILGAGINQKNFMGTGKSVGLNVERNSAYRTVNLSYYDPFSTISGIGQGYNLFYNRSTPGKVGIANYNTDSLGGGVHFTLPISEYNILSFAFDYSRLNFRLNASEASKELLTFAKSEGETSDPNQYGPGYLTPPNPSHVDFNQFALSFGWSDSDLDRAIYPTQGYSHGASMQIGLPLGSQSLDYYKISYHSSVYIPVYSHNFIFHSRAKLSYGNGYGHMKQLPLFLNYHAGGMDTVRSLDDNSLGPKDSNSNPIGGNILTAATMELIFPNPLGEKVRTAVFLDAGNVFANEFAFKDIHFTGGLQLDWISPFGPLRFSFGYPINRFSGDKPKLFQFSIGTSV